MTVTNPEVLHGTLTTMKPMLASPQNGQDINRLHGTHVFDVKIDGIRAILLWDGDAVTIRNRSGRDITPGFPDVVLDAMNQFVGHAPFMLDGEIVAVSGSFQDTAKRDKQTKAVDIAKWSAQIPVQFMAFDLLWHLGDDISNLPWNQRRARLDDLGLRGVFETTLFSDNPALFQAAKDQGLEGVIAKDARAPYRPGRRSEWIKFKVVHSVTCVAVGYEPGNGARANFGAMFIAVIDPDTGTPVPVGRVGTGFTQIDIVEIKGLLDKGELPVVEIECANVTKAGSLRFPVYKGIRTDQTIADALVMQLDSIPRT